MKAPLDRFSRRGMMNQHAGGGLEMKRVVLAVLVLAFLFAGCEPRFYWRPETKHSQETEDYRECEKEAAPGGLWLMRTYLGTDPGSVTDCMHSRGYELYERRILLLHLGDKEEWLPEQ